MDFVSIVANIITSTLALSFTTCLGPAALSRADSGVLERVAENREAGYTLYEVPSNWREYDVLIAVQDCDYVGQSGLLVIEEMAFTVMVVDCQAGHHKAANSLDELGILGDVNRSDMVHAQAILLLGDLGDYW